VRMRRETRVCLDRQWRTMETPWGAVRVKLGAKAGRIVRAMPEFEDCRRVAEDAGASLLQVYGWAAAAAAKGEFKDG